jgi:hypothetical protein
MNADIHDPAWAQTDELSEDDDAGLGDFDPTKHDPTSLKMMQDDYLHPKSRKPRLLVPFDSPQYRKFIQTLLTHSSQDTSICLSCWQYIRTNQCRTHE